MIDEMKINRSLAATGFKYHCETGPAIQWNDGSYGWFLYSRRVSSYTEFQKLTGCDDEYVLLLKLKWGEIPKKLGLHECGTLLC